MSDVVTLARTARESLARGLNALQSDPNVPPPLLELAASIAQAMGALHAIERSGGAQVMPNAQTALANTQQALAALQVTPPQHPAVATAIEAVAGALSGVHALTRAVQPAAVPAQPQPQPQPRPQTQAQPPAQAFAPAPQRDPFAQAPFPAPAQPPQGPRPQAAPVTTAAAAAAPAFVPAAAAGQSTRPPAPPMPPGDVPVVPAELGAHSPTNFYKGLSGNDIVDHGGLFVSTYKLPKIGQTVRLRVSLPGGYEFEANAVVRWRREPSDSGSDAPPGFGAQFTEITPDARHLVYRYVRNREPLFHDDL